MNLICELLKIEEIEKFHQLNISKIVVPINFFTARSIAYFDTSELLLIKQQCARYNIKMYVDVSRMFVDDEINRLEALISDLITLEVDGIYFSDLAVLQVCVAYKVEHLCIYQSDTLMVNSQDVQFFMSKKLQGVCLARELTLDEIVEICHENPNACEVFIHGHALMSISKRPLLTHYLEKMHKAVDHSQYYYLKEELRDGLFPILENEQGMHFFSENILMSFNELASLKDAKSLRMGRIFIDADEYFEAINLYTQKLKNEAIEVDAFIKKYERSLYDSGFYYKKTSVKKEY